MIILSSKKITYGDVFCEAWERVLDDWEKGVILLNREADFTHHLFAKCLSIMEKAEMPIPYKIYAQFRYTPPKPTEWYKYVDVALGESEVLIEVKFKRFWYS